MNTIITRAIGALSFALATAALAASTPATSPSSGKAQSTQASQSTTTASPQKQSSTTTTTHGPSKTGQPNQSCEDLGNRPGNSASAPGSAFNPDGTSGTKYAGEQPQNSRNTASVSQYDVACARPSK
jgi:hypothetical protein